MSESEREIWGWIAVAFDERIPMWAREYASNAATDAIRARKAAAIKEHAY